MIQVTKPLFIGYWANLKLRISELRAIIDGEEWKAGNKILYIIHQKNHIIKSLNHPSPSATAEHSSLNH